MRRRLGRRLARFLACPREGIGIGPTSPPALLARVIRPGDVLLVEGTSRFSEAIKYLTQSTWSHAALYVGGGELVEAYVNDGVRRRPLSDYDDYHTRLCRPLGLSAREIDAVIGHATARLGHQYDLRNVVDLARYLVPTPPVPARYRGRLLTLGSGDPTRAICSSLIAAAFQSVRYPILPRHEQRPDGAVSAPGVREVLARRHHSLFTPRDFDVSPYFEIVKPRLQGRFDPHRLVWTEPSDGHPD